MKKLFSVYENEKGDFQIVVKREAAPVVFGNLFGPSSELPPLLETKETVPTPEPIGRNRIPLRKVELTPVPESGAERLRAKQESNELRRYKRMTPEHQRMYDELWNIRAAAQELAEAVLGKSSTVQARCYYYTEMYKDFAVTSGYAVGSSVAIAKIGAYQKTKINRIILDGKGKQFFSFLQQKLRQENLRLIK